MPYKSEEAKKQYMKDYAKTEVWKDCQRRYKKKHREEINKNQREWRKNNPDYDKHRKLEYRYGITIDDYNRMFKEQCGGCAICGKHQSELDRAFDVDHNHVTEKVRGLICNKCNLVLGNAFDNPIILRSAADYLENYLETE